MEYADCIRNIFLIPENSVNIKYLRREGGRKSFDLALFFTYTRSAQCIIHRRRDGGIGRRARLKISFHSWSEGSIPSLGTIK